MKNRKLSYLVVFTIACFLAVACEATFPEPEEVPDGPEWNPSAPEVRFTIHFIDVGQGDATLISASSGERLLIDGGRSQSRIRDRLDALGVKDLDAIVASHADADHLAGLNEVLSKFDIERIYFHEEDKDSATYRTFRDASLNENAHIIDPRRGDEILLGDLVLKVLNPGPVLRGESNEDSIVLQLSCGVIDVLLMADAESPSEQDMLSAGVVGNVEILKVGHHGSRTSSSQPFLQATMAQHAVISAGSSNQFGHPHPKVVDALNSINAHIVETDLDRDTDDTVFMESDCQAYSFSRE